MDKLGNIKVFDSPEIAKAWGFDTTLTDEEVEVLTPLPAPDRHAALKRMREAEARRKSANTSRRREKNKAARKSRRLQRDR